MVEQINKAGHSAVLFINATLQVLGLPLRVMHDVSTTPMVQVVQMGTVDTRDCSDEKTHGQPELDEKVPVVAEAKTSVKKKRRRRKIKKSLQLESVNNGKHNNAKSVG